jgi:hypothetical protein
MCWAGLCVPLAGRRNAEPRTRVLTRACAFAAQIYFSLSANLVPSSAHARTGACAPWRLPGGRRSRTQPAVAPCATELPLGRAGAVALAPSAEDLAPLLSDDLRLTPKPFDPADYVLTPELVQARARARPARCACVGLSVPAPAQRHALQNVILVTWANDHYFDFVMNWVTNLQRVNVSNFMVGAMDDDLLHRLIAERVPTWSMQSGLTVNDFGWGTPTFHKMGRSKIDLIHRFVSMVRWRSACSHACAHAARVRPGL